MAPVFGLFLESMMPYLYFARDVTYAVLFVGGLFYLVLGYKRQAKRLKITGGSLLVLWLWSIYLLLSGFGQETLSEQADDIGKLPPEAQIIKVQSGDLAGDGTVYFKLSPNKTVAQWLNFIWQMNLSNRQEVGAVGPAYSLPDKERSLDDGSHYWTLDYDPKTQIYSYEAQLAS